MPNNITLPLDTQGSGMSDVNAADVMSQKILSNSDTQLQDLRDQMSLQNQFPVKTVNGQTLSDLVNQVNTLQEQNQQLLNNYPNIADGSADRNKGYFDAEAATHNLFGKINSQQSFGSKNTPVSLGEGKDFERYYGSKNFTTFG